MLLNYLRCRILGGFLSGLSIAVCWILISCCFLRFLPASRRVFLLHFCWIWGCSRDGENGYPLDAFIYLQVIRRAGPEKNGREAWRRIRSDWRRSEGWFCRDSWYRKIRTFNIFWLHLKTSARNVVVRVLMHRLVLHLWTIGRWKAWRYWRI